MLLILLNNKRTKYKLILFRRIQKFKKTHFYVSIILSNIYYKKRTTCEINSTTDFMKDISLFVLWVQWRIIKIKLNFGFFRKDIYIIIFVNEIYFIFRKKIK